VAHPQIALESSTYAAVVPRSADTVTSVSWSLAVVQTTRAKAIRVRIILKHNNKGQVTICSLLFCQTDVSCQRRGTGPSHTLWPLCPRLVCSLACRGGSVSGLSKDQGENQATHGDTTLLPRLSIPDRVPTTLAASPELPRSHTDNGMAASRGLVGRAVPSCAAFGFSGCQGLLILGQICRSLGTRTGTWARRLFGCHATVLRIGFQDRCAAGDATDAGGANDNGQAS